MSEELAFVDLNTLINKSIKPLNRMEESIMDNYLFDGKGKNTDRGESLYQLQHVNDRGGVIRCIGAFVKRPSVLITSFKYGGCKCELVSFLLGKVDILESQKSCGIKMVSLLIKYKNETRGVITLEYHTFRHIKEKQDLEKYIVNEESSINDNILDGFYGVYFTKFDNGIQDFKKEKLAIIKTSDIPTNNNIVYLLVKYLSDPKVSTLFKR